MFKQVIEIYDLLDRATVRGSDIVTYFQNQGVTSIEMKKIAGESRSTDFIKIRIPGVNGKTRHGSAPTLGIIGRLGGIGARPERIGLVSDADGAVTALACALKLAVMQQYRDYLQGDVILSTHICPDAPTQPHEPVPFMGSPVGIAAMNQHEVDPDMDAILSIDTTKGNRIAKFKGFGITSTVKQGYLLRVSDDLLDLMEIVTGKLPRVVPLSIQDITPYGNDIYHINSILQPWLVTDSPVVGVALTTETPVPGCGTGASHCVDIEVAARYCIEVAKSFGEGQCRFYDPDEYIKLTQLYGSMEHLRHKKMI